MNPQTMQKDAPKDPPSVPWDLQVMVFTPDREATASSARIVSFVSQLGNPEVLAFDWAMQEAAQLSNTTRLTEGRLARAQELGEHGDDETALLMLGVLLSGRFQNTLVWTAPHGS